MLEIISINVFIFMEYFFCIINIIDVCKSRQGVLIILNTIRFCI